MQKLSIVISFWKLIIMKNIKIPSLVLTILISGLLSTESFSQDFWEMVGKTKREIISSNGTKYEVNENDAWTYYFNGPGVTLEFDSEDYVSRAIYIGPYNKKADCNKGRKELITSAINSGFKKDNENCYIRSRLIINISTDKTDNLFVPYVEVSFSD